MADRGSDEDLALCRARARRDAPRAGVSQRDLSACLTWMPCQAAVRRRERGTRDCRICAHIVS